MRQEATKHDQIYSSSDRRMYSMSKRIETCPLVTLIEREKGVKGNFTVLNKAS